MRTFIRGRVTRAIAQALTLTFLCSAMFLGYPVLPAEAQISIRAAASQSVAVVPFDNRSRFPLETLGAEASQAVTVELRERLQLDVLDPDIVAAEMRDLGLKTPLSDSELIRLASQLEVTMLVTGEVREAKIVQDRSGRHAEVTLAVTLFDRTAEGTVNGALLTGSAPAAEGDDAALVRKALEETAFEAIQEMRTRPTITATVLWNREDIVYVSAGSRAGVQMGTQMAVIRGGQRLALVQITSSDPLGAYGRLVSGPQLRPGDQLRALYRLPAKVGALSPERVARKKKGMETLLIGTLGLLGLADIASGSRLLEEGSWAAPGFAVGDLANGLALGYASGPSFIPTAATIITWQPYNNPAERRRLLGYYLWADDHAVWLSVENWLGRPEWNQVIDYSIFPYAMVYFEATITLDTATGAASAVGAYLEYDPENPPDLGIFVTPTDYTLRLLPVGPTPGRRTTYYVKPVVAVQDIYGVWSIEAETKSSNPVVYVTPVAPPGTAGVYISGMTGTFRFYSPKGADEAILEIARDPNNTFPPAATYTQTIQGTWSDQDDYTLASMDVDLNEVLALPGSGDYYWYRFGSRNRYDTTQPRPWPLSTGPSDPQSYDLGWVWSDVQRITLWSATGREMAAHRDRSVLARSQFGRTRLMAGRRRDRPLHVH